jgi:hypothetical protein
MTRNHVKTAAARLLLSFGLLFGIGQAHADISELSNCSVPREVKFVREYSNGAWRMNRYVRHPWESSLVLRAYKNPEQNLASSPGHATNCSDGSYGKSVMRMTFKVKTSNYFTQQYPSIGWHIAILMKGSIYGHTPTQPPLTHYPLRNGEPVSYTGRGIIFDRNAGVQAEYYDNYNWYYAWVFNPDTSQYVWVWKTDQETAGNHPLALYDNVEYTSDVWVSNTVVSYTVTAPWAAAPTQPEPPYQYIVGRAKADWSESVPHSLSGTGFAIVPLCNWPGGCEYAGEPNPAFNVHIYDINLTWY